MLLKILLIQKKRKNKTNKNNTKNKNIIYNRTKTRTRTGKLWVNKEERLYLKSKLSKERIKVQNTNPKPNINICIFYYVTFANDWLIGVFDPPPSIFFREASQIK